MALARPDPHRLVESTRGISEEVRYEVMDIVLF
jgi:hypothetical protein